MYSILDGSSNNTNKLSPQEPKGFGGEAIKRSNNTNKLSPQERHQVQVVLFLVQIIQINLVLKNLSKSDYYMAKVQIIQINLVLKNFVKCAFF